MSRSVVKHIDVLIRLGHYASALEKTLLLRLHDPVRILKTLQIYELLSPDEVNFSKVVGDVGWAERKFVKDTNIQAAVGRFYFSHGWYKQALEAFERSLKIDQDSFLLTTDEVYSTICLLSRCYCECGRFGDAEYILADALEEHGEQPEFLHCLALLNFQTERLDLAGEIIGRLETLHPLYPQNSALQQRFQELCDKSYSYAEFEMR